MILIYYYNINIININIILKFLREEISKLTSNASFFIPSLWIDTFFATTAMQPGII